jgi:cellulose synthase/poly-beta-1,6-N-acetylglucosamine synthase-like glycosyltransferase
MVMQTLNALARLDYPRYEVIVLDNNTRDDAVWRPVEEHCRALGDNFRFYHVDGVTGFKAGALNRALGLTDPKAEYIAVIDSDYQASPEWLSSVMPAFEQEDVAVVQAPQDYRDGNESLFKRFCYEEYRGFFHVGMVERNEHNAIIQHGTMCVIRRAALEQVGGWGEWCITEDTELGLRLFEAGYRGHYVAKSMGRGLMPDTYAAYRAQRYRWVYGAMQILKRHFSALCARRGALTGAQRYYFVAGWLPWFADAFALIFSGLAIVWTALMTIAPKHFDVPLTVLSSSALVLFAIKTLKTFVLHRAKVGATIPQSIAAALAGLSLSYIVGKAVLLGLATSRSPFIRTPKCEGKVRWTDGLRMAATEVTLLIATLGAIVAMVMKGTDDPAEVAWLAALIVLAVPYTSALLMALGSTLHVPPTPLLAPEATPAPGQPPPTRDLDLAA